MNNRPRWIAMLAALAASGPVLAADAVQKDRDGKTVVDAVCSKCHASGAQGAPRIGDQAAWTPRLKRGLDTTVRSAIQGHGSMPSRGGMSALTDAEVRNAIVYMFNPEQGARK